MALANDAGHARIQSPSANRTNGDLMIQVRLAMSLIGIDARPLERELSRHRLR
jgi:hypothetical protein